MIEKIKICNEDNSMFIRNFTGVEFEIVAKINEIVDLVNKLEKNDKYNVELFGNLKADIDQVVGMVECSIRANSCNDQIIDELTNTVENNCRSIDGLTSDVFELNEEVYGKKEANNDGYYYLKNGDVVAFGDECRHESNTAIGSWINCNIGCVGLVIGSEEHLKNLRFRRKMINTEINQKYWEGYFDGIRAVSNMIESNNFKSFNN